MMYSRPAPRVRGVPDALCVFSVHPPSRAPKEKVKRFVPIQDVRGYVDALRHEGFYSEEEILAIEKKHRDALPPPIDYTPKPAWVPRVSSTDSIYVKLVVGQTKVKVIAFHPYAPLFRWWAENPAKYPPIDVRAEYHLLLGMPKEMVMKMVKNYEKKTVKALKPVVKAEPVFG
jgi:hypothetical protein